ncbi:MAG: hypothetical protein M3Z75_01260 [Actinomycetota bacterium]|nr:hypothetical protein [Actinomycetota bacterium]
MRRLFTVLAAVLTMMGLSAACLSTAALSATSVSASTLSDCLAQHQVCVADDARSAMSVSQQDQLEKQIGGDPIFIVAAASGSGSYDSAMNQIISDLGGHQQFVVGFYDVRLRHFGAYNRGLLTGDDAAQIATTAVRDHRSAPVAALNEFVSTVKQEEGSSPGISGSSPSISGSSPKSAWIPAVIVIGVLLILVVLVSLLVVRPRRARKQRELQDAKAAAQDDLLALNQRITDRVSDIAVQQNQEAAAEQAAALAAYERGTAALDAARRPEDMLAVSRAIAEAQYRLAAAEALAHGQPRPERRPSCFFDPRHGMSVANVPWTPPDGRPSREVPVCANDLHKIERGLEPEMRTVQQTGSPSPVYYVNSGFAPAYWGGFGFGPGMLSGFLLGDVLSGPGFGWGGDGWGEPGGGGKDYGGGDFGGGGNDYGGGDFGGGDDNLGGF